MKDEFTPEVSKKLKSQFPEARDVRHCDIDKLTILTFPSAEVAAKAVRNQDDNNELFRPVNIMQLSEVGRVYCTDSTVQYCMSRVGLITGLLT